MRFTTRSKQAFLHHHLRRQAPSYEDRCQRHLRRPHPGRAKWVCLCRAHRGNNAFRPGEFRRPGRRYLETHHPATAAPRRAPERQRGVADSSTGSVPALRRVQSLQHLMPELGLCQLSSLTDNSGSRYRSGWKLRGTRGTAYYSDCQTDSWLEGPPEPRGPKGTCVILAGRTPQAGCRAGRGSGSPGGSPSQNRETSFRGPRT